MRHPLEEEFNSDYLHILEAIQNGFRAKVDIKGKLAELYLANQLRSLQLVGDIQEVVWEDRDGTPDFSFQYNGVPITMECKNVRSADSARRIDSYRVELQKTRSSKKQKALRVYSVGNFNILAVCLFNRTRQWEYKFIASKHLLKDSEAPDTLKVMQSVPENGLTGHWRQDILQAVTDHLSHE